MPMTKDQIIGAICTMQNKVDGLFYEERSDSLTPQRNREATAPRDRARHLIWMLREAYRFLDEEKVEKAQRWLGFVQGALWGLGWGTIEEMKRTNMPAGETFNPEKI